MNHLSNGKTNLKMASLNKRRTIEYILEQSISTDTPIRYTQAEMDMKIAELTFGSTAREEKSSVALSYVPVVNENPTDNSSNEAITKSTSSMKQDTSKVVSENKDTETASSRTTEENNSDNIFMEQCICWPRIKRMMTMHITKKKRDAIVKLHRQGESIELLTAISGLNRTTITSIIKKDDSEKLFREFNMVSEKLSFER